MGCVFVLFVENSAKVYGPSPAGPSEVSFRRRFCRFVAETKKRKTITWNGRINGETNNDSTRVTILRRPTVRDKIETKKKRKLRDNRVRPTGGRIGFSVGRGARNISATCAPIIITYGRLLLLACVISRTKRAHSLSLSLHKHAVLGQKHRDYRDVFRVFRFFFALSLIVVLFLSRPLCRARAPVYRVLCVYAPAYE